MELAVIDNDRIFQSFLRKKINEFNTSDKRDDIIVDFFIDSADFGKSTLEKYSKITEALIKNIKRLEEKLME